MNHNSYDFRALIESILISPVRRILIFLVLSFSILASIASTGLFFIFPVLGINFPAYPDLIYPVTTIIVSLLIESLRKGSKWQLFGFNFDKIALKHIIYGLVITCSGFLVIILTALAAGATIKVECNIVPAQLFSILYLQLIVCFFEESFFRGIILQSLRDKIGFLSAAVISSGLFAAAHLANPYLSFMGIINIFFAGILFAVMYFHTQSLWLPVSFHFFWNTGVTELLGMPVSGFQMQSQLIEINFNQSNFVTNILFGNYFGIEEGLLCTFILLFSIYITLKFTCPSPYISSGIFKRNYFESSI
ncbi:MAG: type II CAAX endopeptidase family protein [Candidatus Kapabacteria bacterium]|nr:type II CAAX endopeptidase family protein [Candidatus Kapabacteria bacterium]